jgi:predicted flap endonuclease-1-like 5' DNA nuclease/predicted  nucleic acid-binding Zn-ribbon protein
MLYLLQQLAVPLALAAVFGGGLAGWSWHCIRNRALWIERDGERNRLRNELLGLVGYTPAIDRGYTLGNAELDALQIRYEQANEEADALRRELNERETACAEHDRRIRDLEAQLLATSSDTAAADRLALLETALRDAETKGADLERRAALLEADLDKATLPQDQPETVEVRALRWKSRYLDSRVGFLEAKENFAGAPSPVVDLSGDLALAHARIAELEAAPAHDDDLNRERWRTRYAEARVRYLEGEAKAPKSEPVAIAPPAAPVDSEADNRRRWRQRYLEARVSWLEGRLRDAGGRTVQEPAPQAFVDTGEIDTLRADLAALRDRLAAAESRATQAVGERARMAGILAEKEGALAGAQSDTSAAIRRLADLEVERTTLLARIADLENAPKPEPIRVEAPVAAPAPVEDPEAARLKWRSRYLDSRVRYLEQSIALAPKVSADQRPLAPRDDTFAPMEQGGAEVKPQGLPAARGGAPDDLRMIAGVTPRIESTLNSLGVYHFDQIAQWSPANIDWIERYLAFKGRIGREQWVEQARALANGGGADARRYLEGEPV